MDIIIDRFENNMAVIETPDEKFLNIPASLVPDACEGDVITIEINKEKTMKRKKELISLREKLNKKWTEPVKTDNRESPPNVG